MILLAVAISSSQTMYQNSPHLHNLHWAGLSGVFHSHHSTQLNMINSYFVGEVKNWSWKCKDELEILFMLILMKYDYEIRIFCHNELGCNLKINKSGKKYKKITITNLWVEERRVISISKLLSMLRTGKWSGTIYCSQRTQGLYLDWYLFFQWHFVVVLMFYF